MPAAFAQHVTRRDTFTAQEDQMALDMSQYANTDPHLSGGERALSVLAGLALTSAAAQPRPNVFLSMLALATGSYLAYRGATGYCIVKASLNEAVGAPHAPAKIGDPPSA